MTLCRCLQPTSHLADAARTRQLGASPALFMWKRPRGTEPGRWAALCPALKYMVLKWTDARWVRPG